MTTSKNFKSSQSTANVTVSSSSDREAVVTHSSRAGLMLPVTTVSTLIKTSGGKFAAGKKSEVEMTSFVEWTMLRVLREAKTRCVTAGRKTITVDDLQQAVLYAGLKACFPQVNLAGCRPTSTDYDAGAEFAKNTKTNLAKIKRKRANKRKKNVAVSKSKSKTKRSAAKIKRFATVAAVVVDEFSSASSSFDADSSLSKFDSKSNDDGSFDSSSSSSEGDNDRRVKTKKRSRSSTASETTRKKSRR